MTTAAMVALVGLGGAIGAVLRFLAGHALDGRLPWGILAVNVVGSFGLGVCTGLALDGALLAFLGAGFCGSLTTWSSMVVGGHGLGARRGAAYVVLTLGAALVACAVGFGLTQA